MMMLGPVQFKLVGLNAQKLTIKREIPFAKHKVIGAEPVKEFTGPDSEEIKIKGTIFPYSQSGRGGLSGISALKAARDAAIPLPLVRADGGGGGWYLIEEVEEEHDMLSPSAIGREIEFSAKLCSVGTPGAGVFGQILGLFGL